MRQININTGRLAVTALACLTALAAHADATSDRQQIQAVISSTYDKPDHVVETSPIAVSDDFAVADWVQGQRGGRALLKRIDGRWTIAACGADELKHAATLSEAGIPDSNAQDLINQLAAAEKSLPQERLRLFSLFGTKDDPVAADHHHHHHE